MPKQANATLALNRGVLSDLGLARVDLARYRMAAETMTNWMARVLGSMTLRPGWGYIGGTAGNLQAKTIPFIFGATDTARIEVTQGSARVWVDDALITRPAVATAVTNGSFATDLSGWTDNSDAGCTVTWVSAASVSFVGTGGGNNAILDQEVAVAAGATFTRHALRIIVTSGPITFRCGTSLGDDSLINDTTLNTGTHSLALTPGQANFWIRFENPNAAGSTLASCNIEAAGVLSLPTPWLTADLNSLRWAQSADVTFVGCLDYPQQQFERRAIDSWSIVDYTQTCNVGPFRTLNVTNIQLTPSATTGNISVASNKAFFKPGHVGALFRILSVGQGATNLLAAASQYTNAILVTGVGAQRQFSITITGVFVGTLSLQYSVGTTAGPWVDTGTTYTADTGTVFNDGNDNQSIYYRIGFDAGHYTSGAANVSISIPQGSITGIFRVTNFQNSQSVLAAVIEQLGGTTATPNWYEGAWSTYRGFPSCPVIWGGRLWWFGVSIFGSVSDNYNDFDDTITGGSAPIIGQFDSGPVENIYFAIGLQQLVVGNASQETSIRSDYLGDPVTITNFNVMTGSTQGSSNVAAIQMDRSGIFVDVTGKRVFTLDLDIYTYSYKSTELTLLVPDFNSAGIVSIGIQRKPDTRVHCVRADGTAGVMVYDSTENVTCWLEVAPAPSSGGAGFIEDVSVLPGAGITEDQVYYIVRRIINGQTVRFHEKWALEEDCTGLPLAKIADAHIVFSSAQATTTISGLLPLAGETVCVWGWNTLNPYIDANGNTAGMDLGTYVVSPLGTIVGVTQNGTTTPFPVTNAIVGLAYTAQWKSMKQSFAAAMGTPLNQPKRINKLGLVLSNTHARGIQTGNDFDHLDDLPQDDLPRDAEDNVDLNAILNTYDKQMAAFNDRWSTDSRVCLQASSPRPCTCLAFTTEMSTDG